MVVKSDAEEAFSSLRYSRNYTVVSGLIVTLLALFFIGIIAGRLTYPLRSMSQVARRIEHGDFSVKVEVSSRDELGFLAKSFNSMIEHIKGWKDELESKVQQRNIELSAANQQLQASEQQLKASNQQLMASQQQLTAYNQQLKANDEQLRNEINERHRMEEKTQKYMQELEVFYKANIGREERILDLKKRIKTLEEK